MSSTRRMGVAALCLVCSACGSGPRSQDSSEPSGGYALKLVGSANLVLHPGDERTLQVLLAQDRVGPVPGATVHFQFQDGDPAGAAVDAADVVTDANGVATVHFRAGASAATQPRYKLVATAPDHGAGPVAFSFNVIPVRRMLEIVGSAATAVPAGGSVGLRVRELDADTGAPVAGDGIVFTLPPVSGGDVFWSAGGASLTVETGAGGDAAALLFAGASPGGPWLVTARPAGGGAAVTFSVIVQSGAAPGAGTCAPDDPVCVAGVWKTRHEFDIREALPAPLQDVFYALRVVDQAVLGKLTLPSLPSWMQDIINSFVSKLLQQYMPGWMEQVIHLSDAVATMVGSLRSEGTMRLVEGPGARQFQGTEVWTSLVFYYLPLCNGDIGGDPAQPPECARIDITTSDAEVPGEVAQCKGQSLPSVAVQVAPFAAQLTGSAAPYALEVQAPRQVRLQMGKVLLALIDQILSYLTPYHCVDEITECSPGPGNCPLVDCYALSQDLAGPGTWLAGFIDAAHVEQLCDGAVTLAGQQTTDLLVNAWNPNADLLDFTGKAAVKDGDTIAGGSWSGDFFFKQVHQLPGTWEASRAQ